MIVPARAIGPSDAYTAREGGEACGAAPPAPGLAVLAYINDTPSEKVG
jgi:hypothetical protein